MRSVTITLPDHQADRLTEAVEAGEYASRSDIVREALELWERKHSDRASELASLKRAYEEGLASGQPRRLDSQHFLAQLKAEAAGRG